jgi:hypothetical protein
LLVPEQNNRASQQINLKDRQAVIEITLDMANSMKLIAKNVSKAIQVTDRFHVQN